jgi:poly(A) polymerase
MNNVPLNIVAADWLKNDALIEVMNVLNDGDACARIVGGTVRDALLNIYWNRSKKIKDIDIASTLKPEENMKRLIRAGIKVIPTGLKYGTITAVIGNKHFEITTLRRDIETDGRHAVVEYTDDWMEDAKRRDFRINALYLDLNGKVYDPLGGLADIKTAKVRFIGDAHARIKEDALRILRFFRFSSDIEVGGVDETGMLACVELKEMIHGLSGERIWQELKKILRSKRVMQVIPVLAAIGILREIIPEYEGYDRMLKFVKHEKKLKRKDPLSRLGCLLPKDDDKITQFSKTLKLANKERNRLLAFAAPYPKHDLTAKTLRRVLYKHGKDVVIFNLIANGEMDQKTLSFIENYKIPEMPFKGADLIAEGWSAGPEMGAELKRREAEWIANDFEVLIH